MESESLKEMQDIDKELLHIDMGDFARTTVKAISDDNTELVKAHFGFIGELFSTANPDLKNAIYVSYLENVFLFDTKARVLAARKALPENLANALIELEEHFENLQKVSDST